MCARMYSFVPSPMRLRLILALYVLPSVLAWDRVFPYPQPVNPRLFAIMAWGDSPADANQLLLMKQAGFNISGFCRLEDLEKVRLGGLTCFVSDPKADGYDWNHLPSDAALGTNAVELNQEVGGNPAALGFFLSDEPSSTVLGGLGTVAGVLKRQMPEMWPYVNAFPYNSSTTQLLSYENYLRAQARQIGQPFISYDHYAVVKGEILDSFFTNLEIVRRVSLDVRVPFWACILANAHFHYMEPSEEALSVEAYSALAYTVPGESNISRTSRRTGETTDSPRSISSGIGRRLGLCYAT
jgi:hypothetical protein